MDERARTRETGSQGGQSFDCATWLHKARELPKDQFKLEVERALTGKDS